MKYLVTLLCCVTVFGSGGRVDTFPEGKFLINYEEIRKIVPNYRLPLLKKDEFMKIEGKDFYILKTNQRIIGLKSKYELKKYEIEKKTFTKKIKNLVEFGFTEKEAVEGIKESVNTNEVKPFVIEDFI